MTSPPLKCLPLPFIPLILQSVTGVLWSPIHNPLLSAAWEIGNELSIVGYNRILSIPISLKGEDGLTGVVTVRGLNFGGDKHV